MAHSPSSWFHPPAPPHRCVSRRHRRKSMETVASSVTQTQNGLTELLCDEMSHFHWHSFSLDLHWTPQRGWTEAVLHDGCRWARSAPHTEEGWSEHSPLMAAQSSDGYRQKWYKSVKLTMILTVITVRWYLHYIQKIFQVYRGLLRFKSNYTNIPSYHMQPF